MTRADLVPAFRLAFIGGRAPHIGTPHALAHKIFPHDELPYLVLGLILMIETHL